MDITTEQYEALKELLEDNKNQRSAPEGESFLTYEVVHFVKGLIESYEEKALNNMVGEEDSHYEYESPYWERGDKYKYPK